MSSLINFKGKIPLVKLAQDATRSETNTHPIQLEGKAKIDLILILRFLNNHKKLKLAIITTLSYQNYWAK